jgi:hypothetical protein
MNHYYPLQGKNVLAVLATICVMVGMAAAVYGEEITEIKVPNCIAGKEYRYMLKKPAHLEHPHWQVIIPEKLPHGLALSTEGCLVGITTAVRSYHFEARVWEEGSDPSQGDTYLITINVITDPNVPLNLGEAERLRSVGGYEFSRASSANGIQRGFLDAYFSQPLPTWKSVNKQNKKLGMRPVRVWGNIRLTSVPQQNQKNLGAFSTEFFGVLTNLRLNQISQAAEFLVGLDWTWWWVDGGEYRYTIGLMMAAGAITPIGTSRDAIEIYFISDQLKEKYSNLDWAALGNKEFVAFVPQERTRFYHQFYIGLRFKTYHLKQYKGKLMFPAIFDVTYGLNDAASACKGHFFRKAVFRFDGFLPFRLLDFPLYIFLTVLINTSKGRIGTPLFLDPAPEDINVTPTSPELFTLSVPPNDRDFYRFGIGINLTELAKFLKK